MLVYILVVGNIALALIAFFYWKREKKTNKKLERVLNSFNIGRAFNKDIKLSKLIGKIVEAAKKEVGAEACSLYLMDEEKQELYFEVALGSKGHLLKEIRVKVGQGVAGWVAEKGESLNLADVNADSRFNQKRDIAKTIGFKEKAMLTLPVKSENKVIGVLQFINKIGGEKFTEEDQTFMEMLIELQIVTNLEKGRLYEKLRQTFIDAIKALANAIDAKDKYTKGHCQRVAEISLLMGRYMEMKEEEIEELEYTAILHDVGKIGVSDEVLNKAGKLTEEEFAAIKQHPVLGGTILAQMSHFKTCIGDGAKYHHERYDGKGYCSGLRGEEIPLFARIIAIADTYDAMTSDRVYRKGLPIKVALEEIEKGAGTQFDPTLVEVFLNMMDEDEHVKKELH